MTEQDDDIGSTTDTVHLRLTRDELDNLIQAIKLAEIRRGMFMQLGFWTDKRIIGKKPMTSEQLYAMRLKIVDQADG